jgi:Phasin protein/Cornifin (SPRR) family
MEIRKMSGPNENKPGKKKHGKGSRKAKPSLNQKPDQMLDEKPEPVQSHKLEQLASNEPEPLQSHEPERLASHEPEPLQSYEPEQLASHEPEPLQSPEPEQLQSAKPEPCQAGNKQADPAIASGNALSVDFQTLATAYGNYTKKSFEQTQAFVEKLSGVRSLDKAVEIQTEFAKQAYETFVTESQKIRELYRGLAKQNLRPFEGIVAKKTPTSH